LAHLGAEIEKHGKLDLALMTQSVREVMTEDVVVMPTSATLSQAGREMRERDIGNVIVLEDDTVAGILTDRDIVVRAVADDRVPGETTVI
jgi:CBS domain-containing protein